MSNNGHLSEEFRCDKDKPPGTASRAADKVVYIGLGVESVWLIIIQNCAIFLCGLSRSTFYLIVKKERSGGMSQVVECLPSKGKALSSTPNYSKNTYKCKLCG
jgi:hypothetical protein